MGSLGDYFHLSAAETRKLDHSSRARARLGKNFLSIRPNQIIPHARGQDRKRGFLGTGDFDHSSRARARLAWAVLHVVLIGSFLTRAGKT